MEEVRVYITNWCLTKGIYIYEGFYDYSLKKLNFRPYDSDDYFTIGKDCFLTLEEAIADAISRADAKKKALQNQIDNIDEIINNGFRVTI